MGELMPLCTEYSSRKGTPLLVEITSHMQDMCILQNLNLDENGILIIENNGPTWQLGKLRSRASSISMDSYEFEENYDVTLGDVLISNSSTPNDGEIRYLNARLLEAKELVKQHMKMAEEAVAGWEKAKSDSVRISHELDAVLKQKEAIENIASHLDARLKDSLLHIEKLQEEYEQTLDKAIIERGQCWEKTRLELEVKLANMNRELVGSCYENSQLRALVQDQDDTILGLKKSCSNAEAGADKLRACIETFEKQNILLNHDLIVLRKKVGKHTYERETDRRLIEAATRQHLEDVKKINGLEAACHMLRGLTHNSHDSIVAMKLQEIYLDCEKSKFSTMQNKWDKPQELDSQNSICSESFVKSEKLFSSERFPTVEEKRKKLKETLINKSKELLQEAEHSFAETYNKLVMLEQNIHTSSSSLRSFSISHHAYGLDVPRVLDDSNYKESHKNATLEDDKDKGESDIAIESRVPMRFQREGYIKMGYSGSFPSELDGALYEECLQHGAASAMDEPQGHGIEIPKSITPRYFSGTSIVEEKDIDTLQDGTFCSDYNASMPVYEIGSDLISVVCGLIKSIDGLAVEFTTHFEVGIALKDGSSTTADPNIMDSPSAFELTSSIAHFIVVANQFLNGQAELIPFLGQLSYALEHIRKLHSSKQSIAKMAHQTLDRDDLGDRECLFSTSSNSTCLEKLRYLKSLDEAMALLSEPLINNETLKLQAKYAAVDSHTREDFSMLEQMFVEAKQEKGKLQTMLDREKEKLKSVSIHLSEAEQFITDLCMKLTSMESSKDMENQKLPSTSSTMLLMNAKLRAKNIELQLKVDELQESIVRPNLRTFQTNAAVVPIKHDKEQEIKDSTLKLGKCHHTILSLERHLKELVLEKMTSSDDRQEKVDRCKSDIGMVKEPMDCDTLVVRDDECSGDNGISHNHGARECIEKETLSRVNAIGRFLDASADTKLVKHAQKSRKNPRFLSSMDLAKSFNLGSTSKHGNGLNRFFSRHKKA